MERSAWPKNLSSSRKHAIQELLHAQNPTKKIRHLFDAHSQTGNNTAQPLIAEDLVVNVLGSFSNTLSLSSSADESYEVLPVPTNACVRSEVSEGSESIKPPPVPTNACVRSEVSEGSESIHTPVPRRRTSDTWTGLDLNLIDDGHQWSTDDQQSIPNFELPEKISDTWTGLEQNLIDKIDNHGNKIDNHGDERGTYDQKLFPYFQSHKNTPDIWLRLTTGLDDGHQWRKYGQKEILNCKFPRYYFRCTHEIDQGCQARKQVQKIKDDPPVYRTIYQGHHTCQNLVLTFQSASSVGDIETRPSDQGM